jgi:hypothetical protein
MRSFQLEDTPSCNISTVILEEKARSGLKSDVDFMMAHLHPEMSFLTSRLIDFGLGLISNGQGRRRIRYYLFRGNPVQRNYAALYFKRRGNNLLLWLAVLLNKVDKPQAYSK